MVDSLVGLGAAVEALRSELSAAMLSGHGEGLLFELAPVELMVQAVITRDANGKAAWKVLEVGASKGSEVTQTVKLSLIPVWKRADGTVVRDFLIASRVPVGDGAGPRPPEPDLGTTPNMSASNGAGTP